MRALPEGCPGLWRATRLSLEVFGWLPVIASPELLAVLGVEVDRPQSVNKSVRPDAVHINGEVVEVVPVGMLAGLVNQADGHPVVGVHAAAVLMECVVEGRAELDEHQGDVLLAARDVPRARAGAVLHDDLVGRPVERRPIVTHATGVQGRLGPDKVGMVVRCQARLLCHAGIVAPGTIRNICQMADAAPVIWGIVAARRGMACSPWACWSGNRMSSAETRCQSSRLLTLPTVTSIELRGVCAAAEPCGRPVKDSSGSRRQRQRWCLSSFRGCGRRPVMRRPGLDIFPRVLSRSGTVRP